MNSGIDGVICLESDNEPGSSCGGEKKKDNGSVPGGFGLAKVLDWSPSFVESPCAFGIMVVFFIFDCFCAVCLFS